MRPALNILGVIALAVVLLYFPDGGSSLVWEQSTAQAEVSAVQEPPKPTHLSTPVPVRALYMSSWVAGTPTMRDRIISLIDDTEANAVVIDIKDYSGKISFEVDDVALRATGSSERRIPNIRELVDLLHAKDIYVIGRIAVFQDAYLTKTRPDLSLLREGTNEVWVDKHKLGWLDAGSEEVWKYVSDIGREAWNQGFDELNYDYIRFPSDGDTESITFRFYDPKLLKKHEQMREFFKYLDYSLSDIPVVLSADLFGMTTSNTDDLGIGQVLEDTLPYFDYIAPMIYPSHYPPDWNNIASPNASPYQVVKLAMEAGIERQKIASTTSAQFRPWLQDFSLGGVKYTAELIRDQKRALADLGLDSWMMWDPSNKYTKGALDLVP